MSTNPLIDEYLKQKDQETKESISKISDVLYMHYEAFVESGFSEEQALSLIDSLFIELCTRGLK